MGSGGHLDTEHSWFDYKQSVDGMNAVESPSFKSFISIYKLYHVIMHIYSSVVSVVLVIVEEGPHGRNILQKNCPCKLLCYDKINNFSMPIIKFSSREGVTLML